MERRGGERRGAHAQRVVAPQGQSLVPFGVAARCDSLRAAGRWPVPLHSVNAKKDRPIGVKSQWGDRIAGAAGADDALPKYIRETGVTFESCTIRAASRSTRTVTAIARARGTRPRVDGRATDLPLPDTGLGIGLARQEHDYCDAHHERAAWRRYVRRDRAKTRALFMRLWRERHSDVWSALPAFGGTMSAPNLSHNSLPIGDRALLERTGGGDREAWLGLRERHAMLLFAYLSDAVGDAAQAEELMDETFMRAWSEAGAFDPSGDVDAASWLLRLARSVVSARGT